MYVVGFVEGFLGSVLRSHKHYENTAWKAGWESESIKEKAWISLDFQSCWRSLSVQSDMVLCPCGEMADVAAKDNFYFCALFAFPPSQLLLCFLSFYQRGGFLEYPKLEKTF